MPSAVSRGKPHHPFVPSAASRGKPSPPVHAECRTQCGVSRHHRRPLDTIADAITRDRPLDTAPPAPLGANGWRQGFPDVICGIRDVPHREESLTTRSRRVPHQEESLTNRSCRVPYLEENPRSTRVTPAVRFIEAPDSPLATN